MNIREMLVDHLANGAMTDAGLARVDGMWGLVPEGIETEGGTFYRVMVVSGEDYDRLSAGNPVPLKDRSHSSWSRDVVSIMGLLRLRAERMGEDDHAIIVQRDFGPDREMIDIHAMAIHLGFHEATGNERHVWERYAFREREVIVRGIPGDRILPSEVHKSWGPRADAENNLTLLEPLVGELYFDGDDDIVIEEIHGGDGEGCTIITAGGRKHAAIFDYGMFMSGGTYRPNDEPHS